MTVCQNCNQAAFPNDTYCGNCGTSLALRQAPVPTSIPRQPIGAGSVSCPTCGHVNEADASFCEMDGTRLSSVPVPSTSPSSPVIVRPAGVLVMPDQSEVTLPQTRLFGRRNLAKYLKPENVKHVSRAQFTIEQENGAFYLRDGGPDRRHPQGWKSSVNRTSVNGTLLEPGAKQKLNMNDVIDVSQLGLNLTFKTQQPT